MVPNTINTETSAEKTSNELPESSDILQDEKRNKVQIWHSRYGHLGRDSMKKLKKDQLVNDFDYNSTMININFAW